MFGVPQIGLILLIALVVFGAGKLPDVARALGKSAHDFKEEAEAIKEEDEKEEEAKKLEAAESKPADKDKA